LIPAAAGAAAGINARVDALVAPMRGGVIARIGQTTVEVGGR
jgi:hypothetical protein